ncbi:MAG: SBBP repeat-containing protein, partial [SAR324 cluster bacterium]|nr:SBBP repeat-containing protein [SAR324 cluster bacterium]
MKKIFALLTVFLAISGCDGSLTSNESELDQYVLDASIWTVQLGTGTTDSAQAVSIDNDGNLFLAGYTSGDLEGNGNAGGHDLFLVKYNSSGDRQWSRQLGTSDNDSAFATATDSSGNVFAAGYTGGGLDGQTHIGSFDIFLVKYDTNGNRLWSVLHGSDNVTAKDVIFGMETDTEGNAYLAGYTDAYLDNNTSAGGDDLILIKYNSSGTRQWTVQYGTSAADYARGVSLDSSGNIYLAGYTSGGLGSNSNSGSEDLFLIKYNSSGSRQWTQQLGSYSNDVAFDVATDSSGNTYITGYTGGPLDGNTNAGELDLILVKYDSSGNKSWTKQLGTSTSDYAR